MGIFHIYIIFNICIGCFGQTLDQGQKTFNEKDFAILKQDLLTELKPLMKNFFHSQSCSDTSLESSKLKNELGYLKHMIDNLTHEMASKSQQIQTLVQLVEELKDVPKKAERVDCKTLYDRGERTDGLYTINPDGLQDFYAYCDMTNGGWTVLQKRTDGSVNFTRPWVDYVDGFGDLNTEFWIGLEKMHVLTKDNPQRLDFDLKMHNGTWIHLRYNGFMVDEARDLYRLHVSHEIEGLYNKTTFMYNNNRPFTTFDRQDSKRCGTRRLGGWWYDDCTYLNINGKYNYDKTESGVIVHCSQCMMHGLETTIMKIKPGN